MRALFFSLLEYTIQSVKAVDDQGACVAKRKARVLAAAVGEAFYAVRLPHHQQCHTARYSIESSLLLSHLNRTTLKQHTT
jgi:hypothetical protein